MDCVWVSYPAYETARHMTATTRQDTGATLRWLQFWFIFSVLRLVESLGGWLVPGFYFGKALLLLILWSPQQAAIVGIFLVRGCVVAVANVDRLVAHWTRAAPPNPPAPPADMRPKQ